MLPARTHYEILGVRADASVDEIRRAFRSQAKAAHPDAGGEAAAFLALREAHDVLTDAHRRSEYDRSLGMRPGPASAGTAQAGWTGRHGSFTGDVTFPDYLRDVVESAWTGAPPGAGSTSWDAPGPGQRGPGGGEGPDRPPAVRWWWPHRADRPPLVVGAVALVVAGSSVALVELASGRERWRTDLGAPVHGSPAAAADLVAAVTADGVVHAVDAGRGSVRWRLGGAPAPVGVVSVGELFVTAAGRRLVGIDPLRAKTAWTSRLASDAWHLEAGPDAVAVTGADGLEAVDVRRGRHRWTVRIGPGPVPPRWAAGAIWVVHGGQVVHVDPARGVIGPSPTLGLSVVGLAGDDRRVFVSAVGPASITALDGEGRVRAATLLPVAVSTPAVVRDGLVAVGSDGVLRRLDAGATRVLGEGPLSLTPVDAPVSAGDGVLLRDADGTIWSVDPGGPG